MDWQAWSNSIDRDLSSLERRGFKSGMILGIWSTRMTVTLGLIDLPPPLARVLHLDRHVV